MQNIFIDIGSNILPVLAYLLEVLEIALCISRQILISLLNDLFYDLDLWRLVGIFFACLLIFLFFLHDHLSFNFLLDSWDHSYYQLILLP